MPQMFWFLVGVATCLAATLLFASVRRRTRGSAGFDEVGADGIGAGAGAERPPGAERAELGVLRRVLDETRRDVEAVARSFGDEIASLASAIDGHSQLLAESVADPVGVESTLIAHRSRQLATAVRRLRHFSEKILSFAHVEPLPVRPLRLRSFLDEIVAEIEDWGTHYRLEAVTSEFLPDAVANHRALRSATLFLIDTLLGLESRAARLSFRCYAQITDERDTRVVLEICAEAEDCGTPHEASRAAIQLGYVAARNLLEAQGARLSFDELEGLSVTCFISMPARTRVEVERPAAPSVARAPAEPVRPRARRAARAEPHRYGGVLVLEDDPQIREMIAHELSDTGRKLVSCVDGASARSLIEATPERFEVAILEHGARVESGRSIAELLSLRCPDVRIVLLTTAEGQLGADLAAAVLELRKPFGMAELRRTLEAALEPAVPLPQPD
ncbi:MAG: response regulator [Planctomycetes bacterium]|nr:response regulator [Planctomycetota bacterium]